LGTDSPSLLDDTEPGTPPEHPNHRLLRSLSPKPAGLTISAYPVFHPSHSLLRVPRLRSQTRLPPGR